MGLDPLRLFSLNLRQFNSYVKGWRQQRAVEENYHRTIYGVLVMANRDMKKPTPDIERMWPIPLIDKERELEPIENIGEKKKQLMRAWRLE